MFNCEYLKDRRSLAAPSVREKLRTYAAPCYQCAKEGSVKYRLLVVDDDPLSRTTSEVLLRSRGYLVDTAGSGEEALKKINESPGLYGLVLLDYEMPGRDGAGTAEAILSNHPNLYILIHTGFGSKDAIKRSWRAGAVGFIDKAEGTDSFLSVVGSWCRKYEETYLPILLSSSLNERSEAIACLGMVGRSAALAEVAAKVMKYASKRENVLILGETGTGKERVARALHRGGPESFFAVNCASYSGNSDLMESDLFGYVKGAFTGATANHAGVFASAQGGTVFLDEIHTLDRKAQQKLLRVIQEKTVRPIGSVKEVAVSFRLVAAAKTELETLVATDRFLPDLFERLNVLRLNISPLRERQEDIQPLVAYFCRSYEQESGERKYFLHRTLKYLESHTWPRNVRELENTVRRLCIDTEGEKIGPEHLDAVFFERRTEEADATSLQDKRDSVMVKEIERVLAQGKSQRESARRLGMPESTLRSLIRKYRISRGATV